MEIIKTKRPSIVFLENVPNLLRHDKGKTFSIISSSLRKAGYHVSRTILDSTYFGVPQSRPRIYIVALRKDVVGEKDVLFTKQLTSPLYAHI